MAEQCPDGEVIAGYVYGDYSGEARARIAEHVEGCKECADKCRSISTVRVALKSWEQQPLGKDRLRSYREECRRAAARVTWRSWWNAMVSVEQPVMAAARWAVVAVVCAIGVSGVGHLVAMNSVTPGSVNGEGASGGAGTVRTAGDGESGVVERRRPMVRLKTAQVLGAEESGAEKRKVQRAKVKTHLRGLQEWSERETGLEMQSNGARRAHPEGIAA